MTGSIHGVLNLDWNSVMKVIRHAGVDSRMTILDDQARQQMTRHFLIVTSMQQRFAHHGLRQAYNLYT